MFKVNNKDTGIRKINDKVKNKDTVDFALAELDQLIACWGCCLLF